jgi:hypothetical protein
VNLETLQEWKQNLVEIIKNYQPENIVDCDETMTSALGKSNPRKGLRF